MNIQQLQCFVEVARQLSFTKAAQYLYIGQPALSRQIAELEKELGVKLLLRDKHSVRLTPAGAVLRDHAVGILERMSNAIVQTKRAAVGTRGVLNIGYVTEEECIAQTVRRMHQQDPDILFTLNRYFFGDLFRALAQGDADLIVTFAADGSLEGEPGLTWKKLRDVTLCAVLSTAHPLAGRETLDLALLAEEPFVMLRHDISPGPYQKTLQLCGSAGFFPRIVSEQASIESVCMTVKAGLAVSIMAPHTTDRSPDLRYVPLEGRDARAAVCAAWLEGNINPVLPRFLAELDGLLAESAQ